MKLAVRTFCFSQDFKQSLDQFNDFFSKHLNNYKYETTNIDFAEEISFNPQLSHPIDNIPSQLKSSFSRSLKVYFLYCPFDYTIWWQPDWELRVNHAKDVFLKAIDKLPKSKFLPQDKVSLKDIIIKAASDCILDKPNEIIKFEPIYLYRDVDTGKLKSISYEIKEALGQTIEIIEPCDAHKFVGAGCPFETNSEGEISFSLYKKLDKMSYLYKSVWITENAMYEQSGVVGSNFELMETKFTNRVEIIKKLQNLKKIIKADGYREIPDSSMKFLNILVKLDPNLSCEENIKRRHELEDDFNELSSWLGIGHLDGGAQVEEGCEITLCVMNYEIAKESLLRNVKGTELDIIEKIYRDI